MALAVAAACAAAAAGGCYGGRMGNAPIGPMTQAAQFVPSLDDTIGAYGDVPVDQPTLVRGYGLVLVKQNTGSRECPPGIRKVLADQLNRMRVGETTSVLSGLSIDQCIESMNTAVVEVRGLMPAGGLADQTFDVLATALPNTQTTSLEGGVLLSTDLSIWRRGMTGSMISGKVYATASGPIFINPFAEKTALPAPAGPNGVPASQPDDEATGEEDGIGRPVGTPVDPRRGLVLGGALLLKDRPISLTFREPNYQIANLSAEQLNTVFPSSYLHGAAHAVGPSLIELKVPDRFRSQAGFWLALVGQVYLRREPNFIEQRMSQLADEFTWANNTDRDRERIALTFIAIGRPALPVLQPLYTNENPGVAFFSSWAGLRIGDGLALRMLLKQVMEQDRPYRMKMIEALGQPHRFPNIAPSLAPLLAEDDPAVRIAAYHSMASLGTQLIRREYVGIADLGFELDVVRCAGPYMIYVTRSERPRIVLFGGDTMGLTTPMFLASERTGVTMIARPGEREVTIVRVNPLNGRLMVSEVRENLIRDENGQPILDELTKQPKTERVAVTDFKSSLLVADVVRALGRPYHADEEGRTMGMELNYGQVVHVLFQLTRVNAAPGRIRLQQMRRSNVELANEEPGPPDTGPIVIEPGGADDLERPIDDPGEGQSVTVEPPAGGPPKIGD